MLKYMGSKRVMLANGLGKILAREVSTAKRFIDLFSGSAAVATHVACGFDVPVFAYDLQQYSRILADAILTREGRLDWKGRWLDWIDRAESRRCCPREELWAKSRAAVMRARAWSADQLSQPITAAYGGHYFSPTQSTWIDALRKSLPRTEPENTVCLAALIAAASRCAASPGHTAQPFQPTKSALPFIAKAWTYDVREMTKIALEGLAQRFARKAGYASVADANSAALDVQEGDLVFVDPPYSSVQYSRFYHVLETIAAGSCGPVHGAGRYPCPKRRPNSRYSLVTESPDALEELLSTIASLGGRAILTFPDHECSNGLSGDTVKEFAREHFIVRAGQLDTNFSSLGGRSGAKHAVADRSARHAAQELMLVLEPRWSSSRRPGD